MFRVTGFPGRAQANREFMASEFFAERLEQRQADAEVKYGKNDQE